jgi:hypothetical protein
VSFKKGKLPSDVEDALDDLYVHMNEENNPDLGIKDLIKLKKILFDQEIHTFEERTKILI